MKKLQEEENFCSFASLMKKETIIEDGELGPLFLKMNPRARRFVFRTKPEGIFVTIPSGITLSDFKKALEEVRPRLLKAKAKQHKPLIDLNFRIDAEHFKLSMVKGTHTHFLSHSEPGLMQIIAPPDADFSQPELQAWLHKVIVEALRRNAKAFLPHRLAELARRFNLIYKDVKINTSKGRWGSCSNTKSINLSCYLMLLPTHLIDYVLLHELAHTCEMNHGERFWALLNRMTDGRALALRQELKSRPIEWR